MNRSASKSLAILITVSVFVIAGTGLILAGCGSNDGPTGETQTITLTEADTGTALTIGVGDRILVMLAGNMTTGYAWESDMSEEDAALLTLVGGEPSYAMEEGDSDIVGAGGTFTFTFEAVAAGQVDLKLKYWRSFEPEVEPIETFSIALTIE